MYIPLHVSEKNYTINLEAILAQSAGAVEYTDFTSVEG